MISILPYSPQAVLIQWEGGINKTTISEISRFNTLIQTHEVSFVLETIPAFTSITVCYRDASFPEIKSELEKLYTQLDSKSVKLIPQKWELPILLQEHLSEEIINYTQIDKDVFYQEIIATSFTIGMKGFLPGFIYLAGLPERLHIPRKAIPDRAVKQGSLAIGGPQCGIYPTHSPGGWHVIGNCPIPLIDINNENLSCFNVGDEIQFMTIDKAKHIYYTTTDWTLEMVRSQLSR